MRVFVTGATGVIGRQAVPRLLQAGHTVAGVARSDARVGWLRAVGVRPVQVNLCDPAEVRSVVADARAVLHLATAIPPLARWRHRDAWLDESAAVDPPFAATRSALAAEAQTNRFASAGGRGVTLRMARLYGPGRTSAELVELVQARRVAVVGVPSGVYNLGDDEPVTALEWATSLASALGAPPPRRPPSWVARMVLGGITGLLTVSQRVSNRRFRQAANWEPRYPGVEAGWPTVAARPGPAPRQVA